MSSRAAGPQPATLVGPRGRMSRRVRHEARDALGVVAFSALASTGVAGLLTLVLTLLGSAR